MGRRTKLTRSVLGAIPALRCQLLPAAVLVAAAAGPLIPLLLAGFTNWDDDRFVTANPLFWRGGWGYIRSALTEVQMEAYHPLHLLSYVPDRYLWPNSAAGFHALNLVLWLVDLLLLHRLAARRAGSWPAAGACIIFALHPLTVEPVAWISGRKDLLALGLFLLALTEEDHDHGRRWLAVTFSGLALLTKTSAVCFPLVLLAWLRWMKGLSLRAALGRAAPHALLAGAAAAAVGFIWAKHQMIPETRPAPVLVDVAATLGNYVGRLLWPTRLSPIYPETVPAQTLTASLFAMGGLAVLLGWRRLPRAARFAAVSWPFALLPVANIVPVVYRFADRYALLAVAVLVPPGALAVAAIGGRLRPRRRAGIVVGLLGVAAFEVMAARPLVAAWQSSESLWAWATTAQPDARLAWMKYGETLRDLRDWRGATIQYQSLIRRWPGDPRWYVALFYLYARRDEEEGRLAPATADYWLSELGRAFEGQRAFSDLRRRVARTGSASCANMLLLMEVRRWPQPDDVLLREAAAALAAGERDRALVYLAEVKARDTAEYRRLLNTAR